MTAQPLRVAFAGSGDIAEPYLIAMQRYPQLQFMGATDLRPERAQALAAAYGGKVYPTLDALLADDAVQLVVNLTIHHAHYEVSRRCLEGGKHVWSEKPLALRNEEARELVQLAEARGLRLACAPTSYQGEALQTAWKVLRSGQLGTVRLVLVEIHSSRIETYHPNPIPFFNAGTLFDMGVYALTAMLGPARRVQAYATYLLPERVTLSGERFRLERPDYISAHIEMAGGPVVRLTSSFYGSQVRPNGGTFLGDAGALAVEHWQLYDAAVEYAPYGGAYAPVPLVRRFELLPQKHPIEAHKRIDWARGLAEVADALAAGRPHRAQGAHGAHVAEIITAAHASAAAGGRGVEVTSDFPPPAPMDWAT